MIPLRTIGVLTAGGDCPGLNAVIRVVTKSALSHGLSVVGIEDGMLGLIEGRVRPLSHDSVSGILNQGGTILGSCNKANPTRFATGTTPDGSPRIENVCDRCVQTLRAHAIDALVVIGGDGSMSAAQQFLDDVRPRGVPLRVVGVPKTIDNDIPGTDVTFGFSTAVATATEAIDRVRTTAASHHRVMVVEVMGRNAGWIALHAGVAGGADVILIPEIPFRHEAIARAIQRRHALGRRYSIICAAEGAAPAGGTRTVAHVDPASPDPIRLGGISRVVADEVERRTGVEARDVVLGHTQRGGSPTSDDRVLATTLGHHAVRVLLTTNGDRMVAVRHGQLTDVPLSTAAGAQRLIGMDHPLLAAARALRTDFGEEA